MARDRQEPPTDSIMELSDHEMIAAGPLRELYEKVRARLDEARELHPESPVILSYARDEKALREAIEAGRREAPECDSATAAEILGVSERQATKLARARKVLARQRVPGGPWTFDVRSCYELARRKAA